MQTQHIQYQDNSNNQITFFPAENDTNITFLCLPAMGVRASFYKDLASTLSQKGYNCLTVDWRGQGHSSIRSSRSINFGYGDLINDLKEVIEHAEDIFPDTKKVILGHSLGGQIGCLLMARYPTLIDAIMPIASCSVYYKGWEGRGQLKIKTVANSFYLISKIVGYFPGSIIGFGGREARTVMRDWCRNARNGKYIVTHSDFDYDSALQQLKKPLLAISVEGDNFAPYKAVQNLYGKLHPDSPITHLVITKKESGIDKLNHFSWARQPKHVVDMIDNWIKEIF